MTWKRIGECQKCGECCKYVGLHLKEMSPQLKRIFKVREIRIAEKPGLSVILIPHRCPHLTKDNLCDLHDKGRPQMCIDQPMQPNAHFGIDCKYGWVEDE